MNKIVSLIACILISFSTAAGATDVYLSLSAHGQRMELGLAGIVPEQETPEEERMCLDAVEILRFDLLFSRYFNLLEDGPVLTGKDEELKVWGDSGANVLVSGKLRLHNGGLSLTGQLVDVGSGKPVWEKRYTGQAKDLRSLVHAFNDDIVLRLTGERGIAHSRIVFVNNRTRFKELYLVDYDGANLRQLTMDNSINLLPRWSPEGDEIAYTTYRFANPDIYAISMSGGFRRPISRFQGLNSSPAFSPDGTKIVVTVSKGRIPNLYLLSRSGRLMRRLTTGRSIDTSPSFAPNGREIVFISDRAGYPQPYIMNLDTGNLRRLFTDGYCDSPAWSPRGDKIVFTMRQGRETYDLYVYDLAADKITRLTEDGRTNENPSWSPDGRFIVYSSASAARSDIRMIAIDGSGSRKVGEIPGSSYTPSWSP